MGYNIGKHVILNIVYCLFYGSITKSLTKGIPIFKITH